MHIEIKNLVYESAGLPIIISVVYLMQEKKIKSLKQQCESSSACHAVYGLDQTRCTRRCMSADCYDELYAHDEVICQFFYRVHSVLEKSLKMFQNSRPLKILENR